MDTRLRYFLLLLLLNCGACRVIEQSSSHGFNDGYYLMRSENGHPKTVYVDAGEEELSVHAVSGGIVEQTPALQVFLQESDTLYRYPYRFIKKSLDVDLTSNLFKFRPAVQGRPFQLLTDFNAALYAGWRRDVYSITGKQTPIGKCHYAQRSRGFDIGLFAGPGTTAVGPFSTLDRVDEEYSGFVIQYGAAGFVESSFASFGLSLGFDYLLGADRRVWIYHNKPWVGFIVGIALN